MTQTIENVKDEALRVIEAAEQEKIFLRLIGGLAIMLHSPSAERPPLKRNYADADFVTDRAGSIRLPEFLPRMGYAPNKTFNTLSGDRRQLYYDLERNRQVDIFIGNFAMCHKIPLEGRLGADPLTIPLAELFLTKAQIVELNRKDELDLYALLLDHSVGPSDQDMLNSERLGELCGKDWGLYTTTLDTAKMLEQDLDSSGLEPADQHRIAECLTAIRSALEVAPKSTAWKLRAKVGRKVRWYDLPEEVRRG